MMRDLRKDQERFRSTLEIVRERELRQRKREIIEAIVGSLLGLAAMYCIAVLVMV